MPQRILAVSDKPEHLRTIRELAEEAGLQIFAVSNEAESVASVERISPLAVIVDLALPNESAYALCSFIRNDSPDLPVILLSESAAPYDQKKADEAGATSRIELPIVDRRETLQKLLRYLRIGRRISPESLTAATQELLEIASARIAARLFHDVVRLTVSQTTASEILEICSFGRIRARVQGCIGQWWHSEGLTQAVAERLPRELEPLVWIELTEQLIRTNRCALSDFGAFLFREDQTVGFEADQALSEGRLPRVELSSREIDLIPIRLCREYFDERLHLLQLANINDPDQQVLLLGSGLSEVLKQLEAHVDPTAWQGPDGYGLLSLQARVIAYAGYCFLVMSFALRLRGSIVLEVPSIGKFSRADRQIVFEASPDFLRLLNTNVPQFVTPGAW